MGRVFRFFFYLILRTLGRVSSIILHTHYYLPYTTYLTPLALSTIICMVCCTYHAPSTVHLKTPFIGNTLVLFQRLWPGVGIIGLFHLACDNGSSKGVFARACLCAGDCIQFRRYSYLMHTNLGLPIISSVVDPPPQFSSIAGSVSAIQKSTRS